MPERCRQRLATWLAVAAVSALACPWAAAMQPGAPLADEEPPTRPMADDGAISRVLGVDRAVERVLQQAGDYAAQGRYAEAIVLWQGVLDGARHGLAPREDLAVTTFGGEQYQVFQPVRATIEHRLVRLPAAAIETYRRDVDGAAAGALDEVGQRGREALIEAVERYLLSSAGDDAAYTLACLCLDRGDFVQASRLLRRIRDDVPQPSIAPDRLLARLALADAGLGDIESARRALNALERLPRPETASAEIDQIVRFVAGAADAHRTRAADDLPRSAAPSSVPPRSVASALTRDSFVARLTESWSRSIAVDVRERPAFTGPGEAPPDAAAGRAGGTILSVQDRPSSTLEGTSLLERWKQSNWIPAGDVLVNGDRAYFKGAERLIAVDTHSGNVVWLGLRNRFELTWSSQAFGQAAAKAVDGVRPATPEEIQRYGDRIHHSLSLFDGTLYSLEGPLLDYDGGEFVTIEAAESSRAIVRRSLENYLAAYDARTGRLKWQCRPGGTDAAAREERGFVAAPIAVRGRLVAPVSDEGELWLYALDPSSGHVHWQVFLCDEPPGGCSPWAAVAMAVDGSEVYLSTGAGLVFAIEGTSGRVEWAVRYRRNGIRDTQVTRPGAGFVVSSELDGWERDVIFVHGPRLIVTPSDYGHVIALDRRDGRLVWHSPRQPSGDEPAADTCLGIVGDGLFVAGRNVVRRYDLPSGRLAWQTTTGDSRSRGLVTRDAVYVPVENSVLRLDLATGSELSRSELITPSLEPVGNLYSDGERLLCLSGERLYALSGLATHLDRLAARIDDGDAGAQLERMRLHVRLEQMDDAIADLRAACDLIHQQRGADAARTTLYAGLSELGLARSRPRLALELIAGAGGAESDALADEVVPQAARGEAVWQRSQLLHAAFRAIAERTTEGGDSPEPGGGSLMEAILAAAPFCRTPYLQLAARRAVAVAATELDREILREAAGADDASIRLLAVAGVAAIADDEGLPLLRAALQDADEAVRFEAALGLANRGERAALPVLAALLEAEDVQLRNRTLTTLRALTGRQFGYMPSGPADERARRAAEWRQWIAEHGDTAELNFPLRETGLLLGRTLISYTNNRVIELDDRGRVVWQQEVANPWGVHGLPNGHRLAASYAGRAVYEYDADGRLVWQKTNLPSSPSSLERLDGGNTLVACYSANKLLEIAPDGTTVHEIPVPDHPRDATRLANGNTLVALYMTHRVVEVNPLGHIVWEAGDMNRPVSLQRLDNGNTLVSQYAEQVVEIDRDGKVVWFKSGLESPCDAQRLPTGNTLIVDRSGVLEVDPAGAVVWQQPGGGATSVCRY